MEAIVESRQALIQEWHQVELLDTDSMGDASGPTVQQSHQPTEDLARIVGRHFFAPGLAGAAMPHVSLLLGGELFVKPWLPNEEDTVSVRLCPPQRSAQVELEMVEHRSWIGKSRPDFFCSCAHCPRLANPPTGTRVDLNRPEPAVPRPTEQLVHGELARLPTVRSLRVAPEHIGAPYRGQRPWGS